MRSVELPAAEAPPEEAPAAIPAVLPPPRRTPAPAAKERRPRRLGLFVAAALLAAGSGIWWSRNATRPQTVLPLAFFDALAARGEGEWLVAKQQELLLYSAEPKPRVLNRLSQPLTSMVWAEGTLYGTDGKKTLFCWDRVDAPPKTFSLDHSPVALYARPPNLWTLDESGTLRQFYLAISMTGIFLQPLDRAEVRLSGDFSLAEDGGLILLERSSGQLLGLTREKSTYKVTARGSAYGAGARLAPSRVGPWVAKADGEKTALVLVPPPPR